GPAAAPRHHPPPPHGRTSRLHPRPRPHLPRTRLPPTRPPRRHRPHPRLGPRRTHHHQQHGRPLQTTPPHETPRRLAPTPHRLRHPVLDQPSRQGLRDHPAQPRTRTIGLERAFG